MRVFLAGASGAVGRPLTKLLVEQGHQVTGMTRSQARADEIRGRGADAVVCDALDVEALHAAVRAAEPEAVINELTELPARLEPRKFAQQLAATNRVRREGTGNLVAAASVAGAKRLIAQSIAFAYAPAEDAAADEDAPLALGAEGAWGEAVAAVAELERQVLAAGGIVLRYGYFYGPGTSFANGGFNAEMVRKRRFPVVGRGTGRWSFVHIEDAAAATVAALRRGDSGVYNVVDDEPAATAEWIPEYARALGAKPPRRVPEWLARIAAGKVAVAVMTAQRGAANAKARRELGWAPGHASWREGFRLDLGQG